MKYQTTTKAIKNNYGKYIYSLGYCELCELFPGGKAQAYTAGVYGWNYNLFDLHGIAICTGYRGMPGSWIPSDLVAKYKKRIAKIKAHRDELAEARKYTASWQYYDKAIDRARLSLARELYERIK